MKVVNSGGGDEAVIAGNEESAAAAFTAETDTKETIKLLKAILMGIEILTSTENLIDNIEE